jgi:hypothetical protein
VWLPTPIVCAAALAGCAAPPAEAPAPQLEDVALRVDLVQSTVQCENLLPERPVWFVTYERDGDSEAYGVYGLHDAKARMDVPTPLDGDPIAWPDVDAPRALVRLLTQAGVYADVAQALVERHHGEWFADGLRALLVVSGPAPPGWPRWPVVSAELR